jgi:hypothetical protein
MPADPIYDYSFDFETGESMASASPTMPAPCQPDTSVLRVGSLVRLRGCNFDQLGRVIRHGKKVHVFWPDLDYIGHHSQSSLVEVLS